MICLLLGPGGTHYPNRLKPRFYNQGSAGQNGGSGWTIHRLNLQDVLAGIFQRRKPLVLFTAPTMVAGLTQ